MKQKNKYTPILMALSAVIGVLIGAFYSTHFSGNRLNIVNAEGNRLNNLLRIIDDMYVDSVNINQLVDKAIPEILSQLDPHSVYIPVKDVNIMNDDLKGSFSGVGIEFIIQNDTLRIQNVISDGPAERAGVVPGDKIVSIDGKSFVGEICTNEEAMHRLKGEKGSKVTVGVIRYGSKEEKKISMTRDDIHTPSVTAAYMINPATGYIKIKNFGENTYAEMLIALTTLERENLESLIIDLRDNTGGYLQSAVQMANEFLPAKRLITYTEGRRSPRQSYESDGRGAYQKIPLVVLINEGSASAAEIFAGAMQDNDRAMVIGRRSFGKGLVQQQMEFPDGAMVRLTIARYYTPSGRCIQKPYVLGDGTDYDKDLIDRYNHGEYFSVDSIKHDGPAYKTHIGREVYGGGGITPDIFVAEDTTNVTSYYKEAAMSGLILQYAFQYTDANRTKLAVFKNMLKLVNHLENQGLVESFASFAEKNGLQRRNLMIRKSYNLLNRYIQSRVVYNMLNEQALMEYLNMSDPVIKKACEIIDHKETFPKLPAGKEKKALKQK